MTKTLLIGFALALTACKGDDPVAKMRAYKDKVCACNNAECRVDASKGIKELTEELRKNVEDLSTEQRTEIAAVTRELVSCAQNGR